MPATRKGCPVLFSIDGLTPKIHETAFIAPNAVIIGDVEIQANASVWFGCVLRGDAGKIIIGEGSNVQDGSVLHEETTIGKNCTIAHMCLVHRCDVGDNVLIGNGALVFGPAEIGEGSVIGAAALIVPNTTVPPNTMMLGVPAKPAGEATERHHQQTARTAAGYQRNRERYLKGLSPLGDWSQWLKVLPPSANP